MDKVNLPISNKHSNSQTSKNNQNKESRFGKMDINKMSKEELRDFFQNTEEGRQMMEDMKEIWRGNKK